MNISKLIFIIAGLSFLFYRGFSQNNSFEKKSIKKDTNQLIEAKMSCITESLPLDIKLLPNGTAEVYSPERISKVDRSKVDDILMINNWTKADSIYIDKLIPARANCGVKINKSKFKLEIISAQNLTDKARNAVAKAPKWIRAELENTLSQLIPTKQDNLAQIILDAEDPYIDEIAFAIANSSTVFLASDYCFPQLFLENAITIYNHDKDLKYVEILDFGNSETDDNYYSTVLYTKIDADSNIKKIQVPKDIYYWYIVHPKLSDEIPTYIFPDIIEYDYTLQNSPHTLNIASPKDGGVFWREFLYTVQDDNPEKPGEKLPQLKESISECNLLYDDTKQGSSAIKIITKWINDVMDFNSEYERPHQPVRIYRLHMGRCGEHEDITSAAARACLIPCRGISSWSTDHVWNEFWDERWWQWEPVNNSIKDNMVYEAGWGKKFGSVIARRSDGLLIPVTVDYSVHTSKINIYALDLNNKPIDGAFILVGMGPQNELRLDSYGTTDSEGKLTLIVGKDNAYWAGMSSSLGNDPAAGVKLLLDNATEGEEYNFSLKGNKAKQAPIFTKIDIPPDNQDDFKLVYNLEIQGQLTNWKNYMDDLPNTYCYGSSSNSALSFFVTDEPNYEKSTINQRFDACIAENNVNTVKSEFGLPNEGVWYAFLNSRSTNSNFTRATGWFALYFSELVGIDENENNNSQANIFIFPNPFSTTTKINFDLPKSSYLQISIYNQNLQEVKTLCNQFYESGLNYILWDGMDNNYNELPSGIYYIKVSNKEQIIYKKLSLIR